MAQVTFKGEVVNTSGDLPETGDQPPSFSLIDKNLIDRKSEDFPGKRLILNVFPSIDTGVCAASVKRFNQEAGSLNHTIVLGISRDLPFAHGRFCEANGIDHVLTLSEMRDLAFGEDYGLRIIDGPLKGLLARAVIVIDESYHVIYKELVPEIGQEPDYEKVLKIFH